MKNSPPVSCSRHKTNRLFAVVVHIGRGPNHGHYVAVVKSGGRWLLFDDDIVELVNEQVRRLPPYSRFFCRVRLRDIRSIQPSICHFSGQHRTPVERTERTGSLPVVEPRSLRVRFDGGHD